jgi:hypothetical protein
MYSSAKDLWMGFSKIIFPSLERSVLRALPAYLAVLYLTTLPFLLLLIVPPGHPLFVASLALCLVQWGVRLDQALRFRFPALSCPFHPIANLLFILIGFNSMRWYLFGRMGQWKGRKVAGGT